MMRTPRLTSLVARAAAAVRQRPRSTALGLAEASGAILNIVTSAEQLRNTENHRYGGFNDWLVLRETGGRAQGALAPILDRAFTPSGIKALLAARIVASTLQVTPWLPTRVRGAIGLANGALTYGMSFLHNNGGDGSDQISFMLPTVTGGGRLIGTPRAVDASLWTLAIQGTLSYAVSGWVKLVGESWRSGGAVEGVMRTRTFGSRSAWTIVNRYPTAGRLAEGATLFLECAFPLVYIVQRPVQHLFFAGVTAMHVSIAVIMGLGRFVPAFFGFQGPLHYVTARRRGLPSTRHDEVVYILAGTLGIIVAASGCYRLRLQRMIDRQPQKALSVGSTEPHSVPFRVHAGAPDKPLLVFQNGLLSTKESWSPLTSALPEDWGWVTFDRPGYDGSDQRRPPVLLDPPSHRLILEGLLEEVDADRSREIWFVGHSLGGLLSADPRYSPTARAAGQILIDPTIYRAAASSEIQDRSSAELVRNMKLTEATNRLGFGWLLKTNIYAVDGVTREDMRRLDLIYRLPGVWHTAREEWLRAVDLDEPESTPTADHRLVISSSQTAAGEGVVFSAHRSAADSAHRGEHYTLPHSTHDSMILRTDNARMLAQKIVEFIAPTAASFDPLEEKE